MGPIDFDADDDGLGDGEELSVHQTDPLDSDSDDDGFPDGLEVAGAFDPNDPESHPPQPVPALGPAARLVVGLLLAGIGMRTSRRRPRA